MVSQAGTGTVAPPSAPAKPRKRRRLLRFTIVALPMGAFATAVLFLSVLPALVRSGRLDATLQKEFSAALGADVSFDAADIPEPNVLVLRGVEVRGLHEAVGIVRAGTIIVKFSGPVPLGRVESVTLERPVVQFDFDAAKFRELLRPVPGPSKPFELRGPVLLPRITVRDGVAVGLINGEPYRISDLQGEITSSTDGLLLPFSLTGHIDGAAVPGVDIGGTLSLTPESGVLEIDRFTFGTLKAEFKLETGPVGKMHLVVHSFELSEVVRTFLEQLTGLRVKGLVATRVVASLKDGEFTSVTVDGTFTKYTVEASDVAISPHKQPTEVSVRLDRLEGGWRGTGELRAVELRLAGGSNLHVDHLSFRADLTDDRARLVGALRFTNAFFVHGTLEGGNMDGGMEFDVRRPASGRAYSGEVALTLSRCFILDGDRYLEWTDAPIEAKLRGEFDFGKGDYRFEGGGAKLGSMGDLSLTGRLRRSPEGLVYDLDLTGRRLDVRSLLARVSDLYGIPDLAGEGRLGAKIRLRGDALGLRAEGSFSAEGLTAMFQGLEVHGLKGEIPFFIGPSTETRQGKLEWRDIRYKTFSMGAGGAPVAAESNVIRATAPIDFRCWEGAWRIDALTLRNSVVGPFELTAGLAARDVSLPGFFSLTGTKKSPAGKIRMNHPRLRFSGQTLTLNGETAVEVYGGEVSLHNFSIVDMADINLLSYKFDFAMRDIRLDRVCETITDFGLITGAVKAEGWMELHNTGVPAQFWIALESTPKDGVEQKLDMQAVRSMAAVVEGPGAAEKIDEIRSLAEGLNYSRFGFLLRVYPGGMLYMRGKYYRFPGASETKEYTWEQLRRREIARGAIEYIMVGSTTKQINIINVTPGRTGDFEELVLRFKDIKMEKKD